MAVIALTTEVSRHLAFVNNNRLDEVLDGHHSPGNCNPYKTYHLLGMLAKNMRIKTGGILHILFVGFTHIKISGNINRC